MWPVHTKTQWGLCYVFLNSRWRQSLSLCSSAHLPGQNQECQSFFFSHSPGSFPLVALLEHLGFGSHWIIVIFFSPPLLSLSLLKKDMKGTSFVICIFTPKCIFQVGIEIPWVVLSPSAAVSSSASVCLFIFSPAKLLSAQPHRQLHPPLSALLHLSVCCLFPLFSKSEFYFWF